MFPQQELPSSPLHNDRQAALEALVEQLRPAADAALRQMAEKLLDLPDRQLFGDIEFHLRDAAQEFASQVHATALEGRKKGATPAPAFSAPTAKATPAS